MALPSLRDANVACRQVEKPYVLGVDIGPVLGHTASVIRRLEFGGHLHDVGCAVMLLRKWTRRLRRADPTL